MPYIYNANYIMNIYILSRARDYFRKQDIIIWDIAFDWYLEPDIY